jgi:hypothetical protein
MRNALSFCSIRIWRIAFCICATYRDALCVSLRLSTTLWSRSDFGQRISRSRNHRATESLRRWPTCSKHHSIHLPLRHSEWCANVSISTTLRPRGPSRLDRWPLVSSIKRPTEQLRAEVSTNPAKQPATSCAPPDNSLHNRSVRVKLMKSHSVAMALKR